MGNKKKNNLRFLCAGVSYNRLPKMGAEGLLISTGSDCTAPKKIQATKK